MPDCPIKKDANAVVDAMFAGAEFLNDKQKAVIKENLDVIMKGIDQTIAHHYEENKNKHSGGKILTYKKSRIQQAGALVVQGNILSHQMDPGVFESEDEQIKQFFNYNFIK